MHIAPELVLTASYSSEFLLGAGLYISCHSWKKCFTICHWGSFTNTCKGGLMQKGGALKMFDPNKGGGLKKITTDFPLKIEFTCFSMGLTPNFHGKKGGLKFFLQSEGGGGQNIFAINIFCIRFPPYKCLWTVHWMVIKDTILHLCYISVKLHKMEMDSILV